MSALFSLLKRYDELILKNASQISSIESSLRTLTYVLPGRFADAEFTSETLFALLNLIGLYHDSILVRAAENLPPSKRPIPSPHNRYTRYWINSSKTYQRASFALTFLQYTDVLMEMGVQKKWGKEVKWKLIIVIELIKVICRILLLHKTQERTIVNPAVPRREIDPSIFNSDESITDANGVNELSETWTGKYTGQLHDSISVVQKGVTQYPDVSDYLMNKVLMIEDVRKPPDLVHKLQGFGSIGELLYIIRPLLYVLTLRRYGNRSWRPWLLSISIELTTRILASYYYKKRIPGGYRWPRINNFCQTVSNKPILSLFGGILRDYQPLWENIYFYTASS
ncbi:4574_t:CDS:2 [Diversispora eburnea]|uniref:Peroxisomal membrane protein PEX16 n=1 Tax=Diversispora eburnea TaxID=1213867 RepID=A0A9N9F1X1_9GLOM|nr:4574_t:CDS:2 [Diversispora eburnea]